MATQQHTLKLVAKLDTSDVQQKLRQLAAQQQTATRSTTATAVGGQASPVVAHPNAQYAAISKNLNNLTASLGVAANSLSKSINSLGASLRRTVADIERTTDNLKQRTRVLQARTKLSSSGEYYPPARGPHGAAAHMAYRILAGAPAYAKAQFAELRGRIAGTYASTPDSPYLRVLAQRAVRAMAASKGWSYEDALKAIDSATFDPKTAGVRWHTDSHAGWFNFAASGEHGPMKRPKGMSPGFVSMPDFTRVREGYNAMFSPELLESNYTADQLKDRSSQAYLSRKRELEKQGASMRRWAAMGALTAIASGGQRLADAYGYTALSKATGFFSSVGSMAITGGMMGGMIGGGAGAVPGAIGGAVLGLGKGAIDLVVGNTEAQKSRRELLSKYGRSKYLEQVMAYTPEQAAARKAKVDDYISKLRSDIEKNHSSYGQMQVASRMNALNELKEEQRVLEALLKAEERRLETEKEKARVEKERRQGEKADLAKAQMAADMEKSRVQTALRTSREAFGFSESLALLSKNGDTRTLEGYVSQFKRQFYNATTPEQQSTALGNYNQAFNHLQATKARIKMFDDYNREYGFSQALFSRGGGYLRSYGGQWMENGVLQDSMAGSPQHMTALKGYLANMQSDYARARDSFVSATTIEDKAIYRGRMQEAAGYGSSLLSELVNALENRMPTFNTEHVQSLAQHGYGMGESNGYVEREDRALRVQEEQADLQRQILSLMQEHGWISEYK